MAYFPLLTPKLALYGGIVVLLTFIAGLAYRHIWLGIRSDGVTPTGFGAFLSPVLLGAALISHATTEFLLVLFVIMGVTALFWLDDAIHLSARLRILASFLAGVSIAVIYLFGSDLSLQIFLPSLFAAGLVSVALTNMVNFYDGADLNLATYIALTAAMILIFDANHSDLAPVAIATLCFILPFAVMNSRPRRIYLGDSGSFAFAGLLTVMMVVFFHNGVGLAPEAAIPSALPILDVTYVFMVRIIEKHDMLTRNYLHLYQRLNRRHKGFGYLLPQFINVALSLCTIALLETWGVERIAAVIVAMVAVTLPFYFVCRWLFLAGPPEGPLYETSR
jgi:UDP-N-acetylmuramyl pentapeptide phosphotransferase/UDP-N-acetylglucosamine-1-phosphate transferase